MPEPPPVAKVARCPICKSESAPKFKPFCSKRCADIDLGKWFAGSYAIAGTDDDEDAETREKSPPNDEDNGH